MNEIALLLQRCLEHEIDLVRQFIGVLQSEAQALELPNDDKALKTSTNQKMHFSELLDQAAHRRRSQLKELGFSADKAGLDSAAIQHPALQAPCSLLYAAAREADSLNTANGAVIDTYLKHNQQAIDLLRNIAGPDNLYNAYGRTSAVPKQNKTYIKAG